MKFETRPLARFPAVKPAADFKRIILILLKYFDYSKAVGVFSTNFRLSFCQPPVYILEKPGKTRSILDRAACRKSLFDKLGKFSKLQKSFENLLIEHEGNP